MSDKRVVFCGCVKLGHRLLESLLDSGHGIDHVVTLSPEQAARANVSDYCDLREVAEARGIPVYVPSRYDLSDAVDLDFFRQKKFDLLLTGGWQRLIPEAALETLSIGAIGGHGSADFLPKGRGRSPLNWSIIEDRKRFILHLFFMKPGADDGNIIDVETFDILPSDTIETLYWKVGITNERMIKRNLSGILDGTIKTRPQIGTPSQYAKRTPEDGEIDWEEMDVWLIDRMVRALTKPYPGAFAALDGKNQYIWRARVFDTRITYPDAAYGEIVERFWASLVVNCRGGLLLIDECEPI